MKCSSLSVATMRCVATEVDSMKVTGWSLKVDPARTAQTQYTFRGGGGGGQAGSTLRPLVCKHFDVICVALCSLHCFVFIPLFCFAFLYFVFYYYLCCALLCSDLVSFAFLSFALLGSL